VRLRARLPVLWHGPTQVRLGTDPRWAAVLTDLSPSAARALTALPEGADERGIRAGLRGEQVPDSETQAVLQHLTAARLLVEAPAFDSADAATWGLLEADGDGAAVLAARASATVRVCGLGGLGAALVRTLAQAGVGHIVLDDESPVTRHDVGWAGVGGVGGPRSRAAARLVHEVAPTVRTSTPAATLPDLVVLVEHGVADPTRHRPLMTDGIPHLSVVVREASVLVGPMVEPGRTPCLRCVDLHRSAADPHWPTVAAQLAVRREQPEETLLAAVSGPLAAAQAIAVVDGRRSAVEGAAIELRLPELSPRRLEWGTHPACGCSGL
jgi:hypothetical protein